LLVTGRQPIVVRRKRTILPIKKYKIWDMGGAENFNNKKDCYGRQSNIEKNNRIEIEGENAKLKKEIDRLKKAVKN
jgi:hypothetical protein